MIAASENHVKALRFATLPPAPPRRRTRPKFETTKLVLWFVLGTYLVGVVIGSYVVLQDFLQLGVFLAFIGTPAASTIGFYIWKARAENALKYKKSHPKETDGIPVDLNITTNT